MAPVVGSVNLMRQDINVFESKLAKNPTRCGDPWIGMTSCAMPLNSG